MKTVLKIPSLKASLTASKPAFSDQTNCRCGRRVQRANNGCESCFGCARKAKPETESALRSSKYAFSNRPPLSAREFHESQQSFRGRVPATLNYCFPEYDIDDSALSSPASTNSSIERRRPHCPATDHNDKATVRLDAADFQDQLRELELRRRLLRGRVSERALQKRAFELAAASAGQRLEDALVAARESLERAREEFDRARRRLEPASPTEAMLRDVEAQTEFLREAKEVGAQSSDALLAFCLANKRRLSELLAPPIESLPVVANETALSASLQETLNAIARSLQKTAARLESAAQANERKREPVSSFDKPNIKNAIAARIRQQTLPSNSPTRAKRRASGKSHPANLSLIRISRKF